MTGERRTIAESIAWEPPPQREQWMQGIRVFSVKPDQKHYAVLLGDVLGAWIHWADGRSRPCLSEACKYCGDPASPARWKGYVAALLGAIDLATGKNRPQQIVLELPEAGAAKLHDLDYIGKVVILERRGKARNTPLQITICEKQPAEQPPPAFDVKPILLRLWGLQGRAGAATVKQRAETEGRQDVIPFPFSKQA